MQIVPSGIVDVNPTPLRLIPINRDGHVQFTTLPGPGIAEPQPPTLDQYFDFSLVPKPDGGYTVQEVIWLRSATAGCVYDSCKYVPTCAASGVGCLGASAQAVTS